MEKICIFCRELKDKFVPEHVFPAAIGGAIVISNVCDVCNKERLGKKIDDELSKNKVILIYRKKYGVKRKGILGERNIPNPFKGTGLHSDKDGNKYFISFNDEQKTFEPILVPIFEKPIHHEKDSSIGKLTIPLKDYKSDEDAIKLYAKNLELDPSYIRIIEKVTKPQKEINIRISAPNKPLMLGCLKIAYELAITFIPQYFDDPYSKLFANILLSNTVEEEQKPLFNYNSEVREIFTKRISEIKDLREFDHVALLTILKGKGLYCAVKIFDWIYAIRLSEKEDYLKVKEILLVNDSIKQVFWTNIPNILTHFTIKMDSANLSLEQRQAINLSKGIGFQTEDGNVPVYDRSGKLIHEQLQELTKDPNILIQWYIHPDKRIIAFTKYKIGTYYLKYFRDNFFIPLQQVDYIYELLY